jgi:hypothetical protein
MGTPRWRGEVESLSDGSYRNIKIPSALVQDARWFSPPMAEFGQPGWQPTDNLYGDAEQMRPVHDYPPTVHKAVVLAEPLLHPDPRPLAPLVLVRILNDKSTDVPGGSPCLVDQDFATMAGNPQDYVLTFLYRMVAEKTNIHPTDLALMLDDGDLPITTQGGFTRSGGERFQVQFWFFRYLGRVPPPWIMEPIYDTQHPSQAVPDPRPLYDDIPLRAVARAWIPLGTLLDPDARSHTYRGLRPMSKGPANSLAEAVLQVVYPEGLPHDMLRQENPNVCPHRQFLHRYPGCLDWASAWPSRVGDPWWAPALLVEERWRFFLFREHPVKYEYIDLPSELSPGLYAQLTPDGGTWPRLQLVEWARRAAARHRPDTTLERAPRQMRLAVPPEVPIPPYFPGPCPRIRPTDMESLDVTEQQRRIHRAKSLVDSWPPHDVQFQFALAAPSEFPAEENPNASPPEVAHSAADPHGPPEEPNVEPAGAALDGEPAEDDSDGDDRSVFSAALARNRIMGLAPPSEPTSAASTTRTTRSRLSAHQEAEAQRLQEAEIPVPDPDGLARGTIPYSPEEERLEAQQFWYGQRVWTQQPPREEPPRAFLRELASHDLAQMSTFTNYAGHATQTGYKETIIGSTRPFTARAPTFDTPFPELAPLHASALSQLLQLHLSDHMLETGCPWCPYQHEDLPRTGPDHQRMAAIWHLMATHPQEYVETLLHVYSSGEMPTHQRPRPDWRDPPRAFRAYLYGLTGREASRHWGRPRQGASRESPGSSDPSRFSRLPPLAEQAPADAPEADV